MKVAALGGCGGMGRYAVRTAADYDFVDEIVVADVDLERAQAFAASVAPKAHAVAVDATDDASLDAAIAGCDVVLNTVGPFYRFGVPILRAAIRGGACYLDINDDWEPTLDMLELAPEARDAGVTAVVGLGASPGVSNLLALKAMDGFDHIERIVTGWSFGYSDRVLSESQGDRTSAALVHWLHQCSGTIRVFRDGKPVDVKPLDELSVDYPGLGVGRAWTVGHPEAVTLPRSQPVASSVNVMVGSSFVIEVLRRLARQVDEGTLSVEDAAALMATNEPPGTEIADVPQSVRFPSMFAHASGVRDGRVVRQAAMVVAMPEAGMGGATGVPLACGLAELAAGRLDRPGVFTPEEIIDPETFLSEVGRHCRPQRTASELVLVADSDDEESKQLSTASPPPGGPRS